MLLHSNIISLYLLKNKNNKILCNNKTLLHNQHNSNNNIKMLCLKMFNNNSGLISLHLLKHNSIISLHLLKNYFKITKHNKILLHNQHNNKMLCLKMFSSSNNNNNTFHHSHHKNQHQNHHPNHPHLSLSLKQHHKIILKYLL